MPTYRFDVNYEEKIADLKAIIRQLETDKNYFVSRVAELEAQLPGKKTVPPSISTPSELPTAKIGIPQEWVQ